LPGIVGGDECVDAQIVLDLEACDAARVDEPDEARTVAQERERLSLLALGAREDDLSRRQHGQGPHHAAPSLAPRCGASAVVVIEEGVVARPHDARGEHSASGVRRHPDVAALVRLWLRPEHLGGIIQEIETERACALEHDQSAAMCLHVRAECDDPLPRIDPQRDQRAVGGVSDEPPRLALHRVQHAITEIGGDARMARSPDTAVGGCSESRPLHSARGRCVYPADLPRGLAVREEGALFERPASELERSPQSPEDELIARGSRRDVDDVHVTAGSVPPARHHFGLAGREPLAARLFRVAIRRRIGLASAGHRQQARAQPEFSSRQLSFKPHGRAAYGAGNTGASHDSSAGWVWKIKSNHCSSVRRARLGSRCSWKECTTPG
jgi:hypothetical protein